MIDAIVAELFDMPIVTGNKYAVITALFFLFQNPQCILRHQFISECIALCRKIFYFSKRNILQKYIRKMNGFIHVLLAGAYQRFFYPFNNLFSLLCIICIG